MNCIATILVLFHCYVSHVSGEINYNTKGLNLNPNKLASYDLAKAKKNVIDVLDLIYNRFQLYDANVNPMFYTAQNIGKHSMDIYKYRFAKKILTKSERYLMIFGGSSVTAGHDNLFNSSFPGIVQKRLQSTMDALGIDFHVDNIAQGNNNCMPYEMCYESMGEEDPDFVGWEQSYNCGREASAFEATARVAGLSSNKGSVYYSSSGGWIPTDDANYSFTVPYCAEEWTIASVQAPHARLEHWNPTADDISEQISILDAFNKGHSSYHSFLSDENYVEALAPSGFNVWAGNPQCKFTQLDGTVKSNCAAADYTKAGLSRFLMKDAWKFDSPNFHGAKHHPTKAFHLWRGESIVFIHALAILDAIFMIEKDLASGKTASVLAAEYTKTFDSLIPALRSPASCDIKGLHCKYKATCYTDYAPHFNRKRTLSELVVGKSTWIETGQVCSSFHGGPDCPKYKDLKPSYTNKDVDGELYLKIITGISDTVVICGGGESLKHVALHLDVDAASQDIDLSGYSLETRKKYPGKELIEWKDRSYAGNECTELNKVPQGKHILALKSMKAGHVSSVAHVITI